MIDQDDDFEQEKNEVDPKVNKNKILLFLIPALVVIGLAVGLHYAFSKKNTNGLNYSIVSNATTENGEDAGITVFYDLPEVSSNLKKTGPKRQILTLKINLELSNVEDIQKIDALLPRINDAILSHTVELTEDEVSGSNGLQWLKEELLYRINLLVAPINVNKINIKNYEIQTSSESK